MAGFLGNRDMLRDSLGDDGGEVAAFVQAWFDKFGETPVNVGMLSFHADQMEYTREVGTSMRKSVETLCDLLLVNAGRINLGFNSWSKAGWGKGMGIEVNKIMDQRFTVTTKGGPAMVEVKKARDIKGWKLVKVAGVRQG